MEYRRQLRELLEYIRRGNLTSAERLCEELLYDKELVLVNINCLPFEFAKVISYKDDPILCCDRYACKMELTAYKDIYDLSLPKTAEKIIAEELINNFKTYLENQKYRPPFNQFTVKYVEFRNTGEFVCSEPKEKYRF